MRNAAGDQTCRVCGIALAYGVERRTGVCEGCLSDLRAAGEDE